MLVVYPSMKNVDHVENLKRRAMTKNVFSSIYFDIPLITKIRT